MLFNHILLAVVWIIYCVLHSVLASMGVKKRMQKVLGSRYKYYRFAYTLFAFLFLVALVWWQINIVTIEFYKPSLWLQIAGGLIAVSGLLIMFVCIKKYFFSLSGLKTLVQETSSTELILSGIHRYMRHPLYSGTFTFIWGLFIVFPYLSLFIADAVITIYTLIAIQWEEEKLVKEFGEQYKSYQKNVPKLIPRF